MNTTEQKTAGAEEGKKIEKLPVEETNKLQPLSEYRQDYYNTLKTGDIEGLYTGFPFIDYNLRGLRQTTVLAGAPKTGKTSFCTQLVTQIAAYNGDHTDYDAKRILQKQAVLFYSLEMSKSDITTKIISQLSGVDYWHIRLNKSLLEETAENNENFLDKPSPELIRLREAERKRAAMNNIFIRDLNDYSEGNKLNYDTLRAEIKQVKKATGAAELIVFIDHLQVFPIEPSTYKDQIDKEGQLIKEFNKIALKEEVTMFLISQTNKEAMKETADKFKNLKEAEKNSDIDTYLSGVKGSVDTVYIASGIWSMVKTGRQKYISPDDGNNEKRRIHIVLLALIITERNSRGGVFYVLYFPMEQRFKLVKYINLQHELMKAGLTDKEAAEFVKTKQTYSNNEQKNQTAKETKQ